ncbi:MAG: A/G-specific adenine glycosylase [Candidatus Wenzhouxiangella sp. M2_3B_020]
MTGFASRILQWWETHGRHDLPWQHPRTPYRVWISEIMLQQTRVEAVTGYFQRFMDRFPDVETLASADLDEVLALWSGLGYYARARNLHAAARMIIEESGGRFPSDVDELERLPGVGRSTAAAIRAQGFDRRAAILDGNVKRVIARHAGIEGWPGRTAVARAMWAESEARTPADRAADYTQAIMDLGATLCTPKRPGCDACPVATDCVARNEDRQHELPTPRPRRQVPERVQRYVLVRDGNYRVLLERRPPAGIWGGLWCVPEAGAVRFDEVETLQAPPPLKHAFTHFRLVMHFDHVRVTEPLAASVTEGGTVAWFTPDEALAAGLPRPVRTLIEELDAPVQRSLDEASSR